MTADGTKTRGWLGRESTWALLAALIPVAALAPLLVTGATPFHAEDTHFLGVPYRAAVARAFSAGELPLYSDALAGGHPIHANPHSGWLYPPAVALMVFGPLGGLLLEYVFHLALAGWGAFRLARAHGLSRAAGIIGAVAYGLSGPMVYWYRHYEMVGTIAWLPVLLWAGKALVERSGPRNAIALAAVAGLSFLSGFFQGFAFGMLALAAYVAWLANRRDRVRPTLRAAVGAALLFVCLVAAAAVPTARLAAESIRDQGFGRTAAAYYSAEPAEAFNLLVPDLVPNGFSGTAGFGYVGLIPWLLVPFALGRDRRAWIVGGALTLLVLAFTWGPATPVWRWGYEWLPAVFQRFRSPTRWLFLVGAAAAFVGTAGLPRFLDALERPEFRRRFLVLGGLGVVTAGIGVAMLPSITGKRLLVAGFLLAGAGATVWLPRRSTRAAALVLLAVLDMAVFAVPYLNRPVRRLSLDEDPYHAVLRDLERVEAARHERSFVGERYYGWQTLPLGLDLPNLSGYCQLARRPLAELLHGATRPGWDLYGAVDEDPAYLSAKELPQRLVDLFHVKRLVGMSRWSEAAKGIQDVTPRLPPAALYTRFEVIADARRSVERVLDPAFDPASALVIAIPPGIGEGGDGEAELIPGGGNGAREFRTAAAGPTVLRTTEIHHADWVARVDGEPARTLRVNHCFLGVVVPAGEHRVSLRYEPFGLRFFLMAYAVGWLLVLAEATTVGLQWVRGCREPTPTA